MTLEKGFTVLEGPLVSLLYVNRGYSRTALAGLYRAARVGLVTPLRDGMNLVAKEYVAAQDPEDPGVLVLSRFAGAAAELKSALLVNPYDAEAVGAAIARALDMPLFERKRRQSELFEMLLKHDISKWGEAFLSSLAQEDRAVADRRPPAAVPKARRISAR